VNYGRLPFWYDLHLSPATVLYSIGLTVLCAAIAGVGPALKVTQGLGTRLRQSTAGGGLRFGGIWTAVIVTQIAFTVAFPAVTYLLNWEARRIRSVDVGFPAREYLAVRIETETEAAALSGADSGTARTAQRARFGATLDALRQRVAAEPGVAGVTFVDHLPRLYHPQRLIELDDPSVAAGPGGTALTIVKYAGEVNVATVDPNYFEVLDAPILAGRGFDAGDVAPDARAVIVDRGFVDQVLAGRNAIGRRVRFAAATGPDGRPLEEPHPWYEIVGVVKELGTGGVTQRGRASGFYLPAAPERAEPLQMLVRVQGDPLALSPRVRGIAATVDPDLRLAEFARLDEVADGMLWFIGLWLRVTVLLTAIALLLSLSGIYAVLSFTVARRTREIGVRVALGASRRRVVTEIFRRPLGQVALGVLAGGGLIMLGARALEGSEFPFDIALSLQHVVVILGYAVLMLGVCMLACVVPTRRALRVEPTEALRTD
jgi:putative ABC transport system permease protein